MEDSLELNPDGLIAPVIWNLKLAAIPGGTKIFRRLLVDLPGVRSDYILPIIRGLVLLIPPISLPNFARIQTELPYTIQWHPPCRFAFGEKRRFDSSVRSRSE